MLWRVGRAAPYPVLATATKWQHFAHATHITSINICQVSENLYVFHTLHIRNATSIILFLNFQKIVLYFTLCTLDTHDLQQASLETCQNILILDMFHTLHTWKMDAILFTNCMSTYFFGNFPMSSLSSKHFTEWTTCNHTWNRALWTCTLDEYLHLNIWKRQIKCDKRWCWQGAVRGLPRHYGGLPVVCRVIRGVNWCLLWYHTNFNGSLNKS